VRFGLRFWLVAIFWGVVGYTRFGLLTTAIIFAVGLGIAFLGWKFDPWLRTLPGLRRFARDEDANGAGE
jgi:hypothetical protein